MCSIPLGLFCNQPQDWPPHLDWKVWTGLVFLKCWAFDHTGSLSVRNARSDPLVIQIGGGVGWGKGRARGGQLPWPLPLCVLSTLLFTCTGFSTTSHLLLHDFSPVPPAHLAPGTACEVSLSSVRTHPELIKSCLSVKEIPHFSPCGLLNWGKRPILVQGLDHHVYRLWRGRGNIWDRKFQLFKALGGWEGRSERSSSWEKPECPYTLWLSSLVLCPLMWAPWGGLTLLCTCSLPLGSLQHLWCRHHPPDFSSPIPSPKVLSYATFRVLPGPASPGLGCFEPMIHKGMEKTPTTHQRMASPKWHRRVRLLSNWTKQIWR